MDGTLINCEEALGEIEQIQDSVTRTLVNMAFVHFVKVAQLQKQAQPATDFDMVFLVTAMKGFFAEHDVIARALEGEKVGGWFDEEPPSPTERRPKQGAAEIKR
jgi:hypothetical protein